MPDVGGAGSRVRSAPSPSSREGPSGCSKAETRDDGYVETLPGRTQAVRSAPGRSEREGGAYSGNPGKARRAGEAASDRGPWPARPSRLGAIEGRDRGPSSRMIAFAPKLGNRRSLVKPLIRLGVNIDHVATVRNARGGRHPDPIRAAHLAVLAGSRRDHGASPRGPAAYPRPGHGASEAPALRAAQLRDGGRPPR